MNERLNETIKDNQAIRDLAHVAMEEARRTGHATFLMDGVEISVDFPPNPLEVETEILRMEGEQS